MLVRIDILLCSLVVLFVLASRCSAGQPDYIGTAIQTANWLESVEIETEAGLAWPVVAGKPGDAGAASAVQFNLYSGTPGVVLFLIELSIATGDDGYLERARRGADELIAALPEELDPSGAGLWTGAAGRGFVLYEVYKATGDER